MSFMIIVFGLMMAGIGIVILINLFIDSMKPKIHKVTAPWRDPMNNPHYKSAMNELDEIDIALGIMEPKPKPRQYIKAPHQLTSKQITATKSSVNIHAMQCMTCNKLGIHTYTYKEIGKVKLPPQY